MSRISEQGRAVNRRERKKTEKILDIKVDYKPMMVNGIYSIDKIIINNLSKNREPRNKSTNA